jgi:glycosyltransferase involved in cell wall biosynthesis
MDPPLITFIIPTLGRLSLSHTIQSLQKQKINSWKCIILFDGIKNIHFTHFLKDPRIMILEIPKTGESISGSRAGLVRNLAFPYVSTTWLAFVDDDDTLSPYYLSHFQKETEKEKEIDVLLFRMIYRDGVYLPPAHTTQLEKGKVGISFAIRTSCIQKDETLRFLNHPFEDFLFLQLLLQKKHSILLSSHITYYVKSKFFPFDDSHLSSLQITLPNQHISNPKKRLFVSLKGGLGNLLFQIYTGLHFAKIQNRDLFFINENEKTK